MSKFTYKFTPKHFIFDNILHEKRSKSIEESKRSCDRFCWKEQRTIFNPSSHIIIFAFAGKDCDE